MLNADVKQTQFVCFLNPSTSLKVNKKMFSKYINILNNARDFIT